MYGSWLIHDKTDKTKQDKCLYMSRLLTVTGKTDKTTPYKGVSMSCCPTKPTLEYYKADDSHN